MSVVRIVSRLSLRSYSRPFGFFSLAYTLHKHLYLNLIRLHVCDKKYVIGNEIFNKRDFLLSYFRSKVIAKKNDKQMYANNEILIFRASNQIKTISCESFEKNTE